MTTQDQLEQLAIQWFQDTGWPCLHGNVIAPEGDASERENCWAVVLKGHLEKAATCKDYLPVRREGGFTPPLVLPVVAHSGCWLSEAAGFTPASIGLGF